MEKLYSGTRFFSVVLLLFLYPVASFSQLHAGFTSSAVSGCTPFVAVFTDTSTGTPLSYFWDFGNGVTSNQQNPGAVYKTPGNYTVKLIVKDASGADTAIRISYITVYAKPAADFSIVPNTGCAPLPVQLNDKSTTASGTLSQWSWDFGDGQVSTDQNPLHNYTTIGAFSVSLTVTNNFGCTNFLQKPSSVTVNGIINADFAYTYNNACTSPTKVNFTSTNNSITNITYQWLFGNGDASSLQNPVYVYNSNGTYNVQLIVSTDLGCKDTIAKSISIGTVHPDFFITIGACKGSRTVFHDRSSPSPVFVNWDFGDGSNGTGLIALHPYQDTGKYTVKLVANFGSCTDSISRVVTITTKPTADFTFTGDTNICRLPYRVQFQNTSLNAVNYRWNFGDGGVSSTINPTHSYIQSGFYDLTLIAINPANGCNDTLVRPQFVQVGPPKINGLVNAPFTACIPAAIDFKAAISSGRPITSYVWTFGDGATSTNPTQTHIYPNAGTYTVTLKVKTSSGCASSASFPDIVKAGDKPIAGFSTQQTDICASTPVQFTDTSKGNITARLWTFGDGKLTDTTQNPVYLYKDTGLFTITLITESNGCTDTAVATNYIHINPPVADFYFTLKCNDKLTRKFTDISILPKTWKWDFGDGTILSAKSPSHTYPSTGTYIVSLTVANKGCTNTKVDTVHVATVTPSFTYQPSPTVCRNSVLQFSAINYDKASVKSFYWDYGDGRNSGFVADSSFSSHKYNKAGAFTPFLVIKDTLGCLDTAKAGTIFNVYGPVAAFSSTSSVCTNKPVFYNDLSTTDGTHLIQKWIWNYGDGVTDTLAAPPFLHIFTKGGLYDVTLTVTDSYGCIDSIKKKAADTISQTVANFSLLDSIRCSGSSVNFNNLSQGLGLAYNWSFGDNKTSNQPYPQHIYNTGVYTVALGITDQFGCKDSITKVNYVTIANPHAAFTLPDTVVYCPPLIIAPQSTVTNYTFFTWYFGDGNTSHFPAPNHTYTLPGAYTLQLVVQGHGNCSDTASKIVTLLGPTGSFKYTPDKACLPATVAFTATGHNIAGYQWLFDDNNTETTTKPQIDFVYNQAGVYLPKLTIVDASGCQVELAGTDSIRISGVIAKFGVSTGPNCDSVLVSFSDSSSIFFDTLLSHTWNFGDGTTSPVPNHPHLYRSSGIKNISYSLRTIAGCTSTYTLPVNIVVNQSPVIQAVIPSSVCVNAPVSFAVSNSSAPPGTIIWLWKFGNGSTSPIQNTSYTYTAANTYTTTVTAVNEFGCSDTAQGIITVQPLPLVDAGPDSTICLGQSVVLQPTGATGYTWSVNASLNCTSCNNPVAKPDSTTEYYVTGTAAGCTATDSISLKVKQPSAVVLPLNDSLCAGNSVQVIASGAEVFNWQPPAGLNDVNAANPVASPAATTTYTVTGSDTKKCFSSSASITITVINNPLVNIADTVVTILTGRSYVPAITASSDVTRWQWTPAAGLSCPDCAEPVMMPNQTTKYQEKVFNNFGCSAIDNITVQVLCNETSLFIPNTFSPNGDGMNDYFYPRGFGLYTIRALRIFNRWGQVVFEKINFLANDQSSAWDGKFKGNPQPADVYVYSIDVICDNGTVLTRKGDITLLR